MDPVVSACHWRWSSPASRSSSRSVARPLRSVSGLPFRSSAARSGAVRAIAVVTGIPGQGIENLPGTYTSNPQAFSRRFNCTGRAIQVKHGSSGQYDVRALGISGARLPRQAACRLRPGASPASRWPTAATA